MAKLTQKQVVLRELKQAGRHGRRSDFFLDLHIPRVAARVWELRDDGYNISSTREKQFTRYRLHESAEVPRFVTGPSRECGASGSTKASGHPGDLSALGYVSPGYKLPPGKTMKDMLELPTNIERGGDYVAGSRPPRQSGPRSRSAPSLSLGAPGSTSGGSPASNLPDASEAHSLDPGAPSQLELL